MKFHLNYKPAINVQQMSHQQGVLLIGSCFSEHIYNKLNNLKFTTKTNPFGIVFNPKSIALSINRILTKNYFTINDVFEKEGLWFCFEAHTSIFKQTQIELVNSLNTTINEWYKNLKMTKWLIITVGSAYAYKHTEQQQIVANCHKLPHSIFEKQLLQSNDIVADYSILIGALRQINPELQIILTVSPVKHLRDGIIENSLSKAILLQAVHQLVNQHTNCQYFPAYELVTDDLRDYRFYKADMAHPNDMAIDYVWQKFEEVYFSDDTKLINLKLADIHSAYNHKPLNKGTEAFTKFKSTYYKKCETLQTQYPWVNLSQELAYFKND